MWTTNDTSSFRIAASAFAFCRFSQAVIFASSLLHLKITNNQVSQYKMQQVYILTKSNFF